jgi:single-stranded-DNA-specific exonuclease
MTWNKPAIDAAAVKEIARRFQIDLLPATILARRGISAPGDLLYYLESDPRYLHNPFLMPAMADAVDRINAAIDSGEKILIFGDRDVDGITATVLLFEALVELGADAQWMLPEGEDGYGLSPAVVGKAREAGVGLLVTVDCGISNGPEIVLAGSFGIDTVVIDHHNPPAELPSASAVVNPKLDGYPFRDLCACAVASKVEWALRFSRSPFYGATVCLLNARPANETVVVEAVLLTNLRETERVTEDIVPGLVPFEKTRLARVLLSDEILVLDQPGQARLLARAFGPDLALPLSDLAPLVAQFLPELAGKSLLRIRQASRSERYAGRSLTEVDTLVDTFVDLVLARERERMAPALARLDLVTLGTLADLMPLGNENRIMVRAGLTLLRSTARNGLRQILRRRDLLGKKLSAADIAWQVSPVLNSAGRMGEPGTATRLLLAASDSEAEAIAEELFALDARRKSFGENAWNLAQGQAKESLEKTGGRCILVHDGRIQRGITGIMASRLQGYFKAPAVVISETGETAVGSIRCNRPRIIDAFFQRHGASFISYGGHDFAGGFSLSRDRVPDFLASFYENAGEIEAPAAAAESLTVDAEVPVSYLTPQLVETVDLFEPYGEGNAPLLFLTRGLRVAHCELIGRRDPSHLKLLLDSGKTKWPAVFWNAAARFPSEFTIGDTVDVVYRLGRNSYGGGENLQLTVLDLRK